MNKNILNFTTVSKFVFRKKSVFIVLNIFFVQQVLNEPNPTFVHQDDQVINVDVANCKTRKKHDELLLWFYIKLVCCVVCARVRGQSHQANLRRYFQF